ncbi:hypothetical protein BESB_074050 [Besnoitia besnoiti]|uniref:Uncharacterized protein n=1 Tax=Besnoitia besnoiti TaxID=94643 RepID=A0A2A9MF07_BESBE|nr:uncharacterized protein BESB_074050 [Besnoitia besnoiti]PFH34253.1 hypothetical protein BESB_074050 [Besnoitia besnoiti]
MGKNGEKVFGPFLPSEQHAGDDAEAASSPEKPPHEYPQESPEEVWDALRLHLSLLLQQAAFDLNLPMHAATAAVSAFRCVFPKYFTKEELETRPRCVARCMAACLFFAGKASDTNLKLRESVNCIEFLNWRLKNLTDPEPPAPAAANGEDMPDTEAKQTEKEKEGSGDEPPVEKSEEESSSKGEGPTEGEQTDGPPTTEAAGGDRGQKKKASGSEKGGSEANAAKELKDEKRQPRSRLRGPQSLPSFLRGYEPMGIREYWKIRQECLLEEQRLCQALGFSLELPLLHDAVLEAQLLLLFSHREVHLMWAIVNDIAATPLIDQFSVPVLIAAAAICAKKLARVFIEESEAASLAKRPNEHSGDSTGKLREVRETAPASDQAVAETAKQEQASGRKEDARYARGQGTDARAVECAKTAVGFSSCSDTREVLQRLSPLLEGSPEFWPLVEARNASALEKIGFGSQGDSPRRSPAVVDQPHKEDADKQAAIRRQQRTQLYVHLAEVCSRLLQFYGLVAKYHHE